jgi:UDP-N-acetyl-D-mannosaminuronic acid dehydrogenase
MFDVCVVGLGHVGLPTAALIAHAGWRVQGVDTSPTVIHDLAEGRTHIREPGLPGLVADVVRNGSLTVAGRPAPAAAYIVAVPTPLDINHQCDLRAVQDAVGAVIPVAPAGALVIIESTVPPGTTERVIGPLAASAGRTVGEDLLLAFCPERALPGHTLREIGTNPRLIGGATARCTAAAMDLYRRFVDADLFPCTATQAETAKLFENTFRDVNIALANQFAQTCELLGIPALETIALANHHPRVDILSPGIGVGGHCIPVDPYFLLEANPAASLVRAARTVNRARPREVASRIEAKAREIGARTVALLGLTYKADSEDMRESPALEIMSLLSEASFELIAYDPYAGPSLGHASSLASALERADLVAILVAHEPFRAGISPVRPGQVVLDFTASALSRAHS